MPGPVHTETTITRHMPPIEALTWTGAAALLWIVALRQVVGLIVDLWSFCN